MKDRFFSLLFTLTLAFGVHNIASADTSPLYRLSFPDVDNTEVELSAYKGKVVLLNFWATWCPPCVKEMPSMQRLYSKFKGQDFEIVAINAGESPTTVESFLLALDNELTFPILLDEKGRSFQKLGIRGLPMSFLFDQNGKLIKTITGSREWDEQREVNLIEATLNQ